MGDEAAGEATNVRVMVRVRPFNKREITLSQKKKERLEPVIKMRGNTCVVMEYTIDDKGFTHEKEREAFSFDMCFWSMPPAQGHSELPFATQEYVYNNSGKLALQHLLQGFNVCIFAYGQTGSGKTHSMLGTDSDPGVSPRLVDELFATYDKQRTLVPTTKVIVDVMFFEIYNEKVRDLFNKKAATGEYDAPRIRQHPTKGVYVEGLKRNEVFDAAKTKGLLEWGTSERAMAETKMNATSSRSHAVFQIQVTQNDALKGTQKISTINLVDLAGSEKVKMSGVTGDAFAEAKNINQSLSTLRRVIDVLIENSQSKKQKPAPFRESVLTYLLSDSLGGNSKTMMLSAISPHESNIEDTLGTLRYALRAKAIVCNAKVNEEKSAAMMDAMKDELARLRENLAKGGTGAGPDREMSEEEVKQAIAEREAEMAKMEAEQAQMNDLIAETKRRETEAHAQMVVAEEQKQQLTLAVKAQKMDRFANAFRQAFMMGQDKQKIETSKAELEEAHAQKEVMVRKADDLELQLAEKSKEADEVAARLKAARDKLADIRAASEAHVNALTETNTALLEEKHRLQRDIDAHDAELHKLKHVRAQGEVRLARMQDDVLTATRRLEQIQKETEYIQDTLELATAAGEDRHAEVRRRKDKYKSEFLAHQSQADAMGMLCRERIGDKANLVETVRAQQQLLEERDALIAHLQAQIEKMDSRTRRARESEERKDDEIAVMTEALEEHHAASMHWMSQHAAMEKELLHLRQHTTALPGRSAAGAAYRLPGAPGGAGRSLTPRRGASPMMATGGGSTPRARPAYTDASPHLVSVASPAPTKPRWSHV